jgi:hypothetical protein
MKLANTLAPESIRKPSSLTLSRKHLCISDQNTHDGKSGGNSTQHRLRTQLGHFTAFG